MRLLLVVGVLALLGLSHQAGSAWAKGPVEICGGNGCKRLRAETHVAVNLGTLAGRERVGPATPARFFSIRFRNAPGSPLAYWIPAANILRIGYQRALWVRPGVAEVTRLRAATTGLRPLPPPKNVTAAVDLEPVAGDLSYLRLYTVGEPTTSAANNGGWLKILIFQDRPTPWADGKNTLWISRQGALLRRDGQLVAIPPAVATQVRARLPLTGR
jgi:hypothetical protein